MTGRRNEPEAWAALVRRGEGRERAAWREVERAWADADAAPVVPAGTDARPELRLVSVTYPPVDKAANAGDKGDEHGVGVA